MAQINSNIKDDFQVVLLLPCFVGHPVTVQHRQLDYKTVRQIDSKSLENNKAVTPIDIWTDIQVDNQTVRQSDKKSSENRTAWESGCHDEVQQLDSSTDRHFDNLTA